MFADLDYTIHRPDRPITLVVERGRVTGALDSTPRFERVLAGIRADEGEVWLREFGLGMNRAFTLERTVKDVGTLERMCGVHLSLGAKHASFQKPHIKTIRR
jgi:aminopeptidase